MKTNTLALLGLVAASHALPARDKKAERRQFQIGDSSSDFCLVGGCEGDSSGGGAALLTPEDLVNLLPPGVKLPPGFKIPRKRGPQNRGGGSGGWGRGGRDDGYGTIKPDDPWSGSVELEPSLPDEITIVPGEPDDDPEEVPQEDVHEYPDPDEEEPEPEYPAPEYPEPEYPEPEPEPEWYPAPEEPEPEYPEEEEHEYPDEDGDEDTPQIEVTMEDIIEAQQELLIMEQLVAQLQDSGQVEAIKLAIEKTKKFLKEHAGFDEISVPGTGGGSIVVPTKPPGMGRRSNDDTFLLFEAFTELTTSSAYNKKGEPSFPLFMVASQLAELLIQEGYEIDPKILGAWTTLTPGRMARRQDGIFALPGSCGVDDIIALETTLATIGLIYGEFPPAHIRSLRNAITAALVFCYMAEAETTISPNNPSPGGSVTPVEPEEGGSIIPSLPEEGGSIEVEEPEEGGSIEAEEPEEGGSIEAEVPEEGGSIEPEEPEEGGEIDIEVPEQGGRVIPGRRMARAIVPVVTVPGGAVVPVIPSYDGRIVPESPVDSSIVV